ncbi:MAG: response regulator [Candidatus Sulfopaludibacter sp.]|nr:response regulator [Candidatus Sulfopaludibacter sp.]
MTELAHRPNISALLVGEYSSERILVQDVFRKCGWRLFEARNRRRALHSLEQNEVHVVIAESDLPKWNWRKVLSDLRRLALPPQLVVTSRTADEHLWAEVLNVGAYDVLAQPLDREEVERVVAAASRQFEQQRLRQRPAAFHA